MGDREQPTKLPNETPRPPGELAELKRVWAPPKGWRAITAVNNTQIGIFYILSLIPI